MQHEINACHSVMCGVPQRENGSLLGFKARGMTICVEVACTESASRQGLKGGRMAGVALTVFNDASERSADSRCLLFISCRVLSYNHSSLLDMHAVCMLRILSC